MQALFSVKNKVIVITGASSGLGQHFSMTLANAGAQVIMCARRLDKLKKIATEINNNGGIALPFEVNITQTTSIKNMLKEVELQLGKIDVLINNAGVDSRKNVFETK